MWSLVLSTGLLVPSAVLLVAVSVDVSSVDSPHFS